MKLLILITIITQYIITITECQQSRNLINIQILNRTQIIKLNEQNTLSVIVSSNRNQNEKVKQWTFARNSTNANRNIIEEKIYDDGRFLSDPSRYQCKPSNDNCDELVLLRSSKSDVGQYMRYAQGTLNHTFLSYLVTGYEAPIQVECIEQIRGCSYDFNTKKLSVKEMDTILLRARVNIWRGDVYEIPSEIYYKRDYREECTSEQTERRVKAQNLNEPAEAVEFSKRCTQSYTKNDNSQKLSIGLRYTNNDVYSQLPIDQLDIQLDIHYGPVKGLLTNNDVNKTVFTGTPITLKCPFDGNPIQYFWKPLNQLDATESVGEKEFILPKNLQPGTYQYQCRAFVDGYSKTSSDSVQFYVSVVDGKASLKKANLPAIIGGAVGGLVALILIVVLIVFVVRCRNRNDNNTKDDVDKSTTKHNNSSPKNIPKPIIKNKPVYKVNSNNQNSADIRIDDESSRPLNSEVSTTLVDNMNEFDHLKPTKKSVSSLDEANNNDLPLGHPMPNKRGAKGGLLPPVDKTIRNYPTINDHTKGASDTVLGSSSTSTTSSSENYGAYSPSVAEARRNDAAAPKSNISQAAKLSTSKTNLAGAYKVLPTENKPFKLNQNTGESPPSYDAALQQTNEDTTPKTLPKHYQPQQVQHYQSQQTLLQQQQQRDAFLNASNKNLNNSQSYMFNNAGSNQKLAGGGAAASMLQYTSPHINQSDQRLNQQPQLQYSDVVNINNRPRNRDPMQTNANEQTQYTSVSQFTSSKPMIV